MAFCLQRPLKDVKRMAGTDIMFYKGVSAVRLTALLTQRYVYSKLSVVHLLTTTISFFVCGSYQRTGVRNIKVEKKAKGRK